MRGAMAATGPDGNTARPVSMADQPRTSCMYRVTTNSVATHPPVRTSAPTLARTRSGDRRMPRRSRGAAARRSMATNRASRATTPNSEPSVRPDAHPHTRGLDERRDEQQHRRGHGDGPGDVEAAPRAFGAAVVGHQAHGRGEDEQGQGHRHEEHQPPVRLGQQAADDEAEREAGRAGGAVDREGAVACGPLGERGGDDGQAGRGGEGGADAGDEAGDHEQRPAVGEAAEAGEHGEDREPADEHAATPQQVGRPPAEQQEAAVAEHVRADDPLQRVRRHAEVGADRGKRDTHHRDVEGVEEQGAAQHDQHAPRSGGEVRVGGVRRAGGGGGGHADGS